MSVSFFKQTISIADIVTIARNLDEDLELIGSDAGGITNTARFNTVSSASLKYFDGKASGLSSTISGRETGCLITTAQEEYAFDKSLKIISKNPRRLYIKLINSILTSNEINYSRSLASLSDMDTEPQLNNVHEAALILPGCQIGRGCSVEAGSIVFPGVILEENVSIKAGTLVGTSGAAIDISEHETVSQPHVGFVVIGANTEIGSQCNIVRGIFGSTRIGARTVIGNQVNVGHNVEIGHGVWVGAGSIVSGFSTVGDFTNIGVGALLKNGIVVGSMCNVSMGSVVTKSLQEGMSCFGNPAKHVKFKLTAGPALPFKT